MVIWIIFLLNIMKKEFIQKFTQLLNDKRTKKVLGFLIAKGFLLGEGIKPKPNVKILIEEALWVGKKVEPRVLEVLPAALIHFPKTFIGYAFIPLDLMEIIECIKKNKEMGPDYFGIRYQDMKRWAEKSSNDKRTKPLSQIRVNKTLRFNAYLWNKIKSHAQSKNISLTQYLEDLIKKDLT